MPAYRNSKVEKDALSSIAERHLGIICTLCVRYWKYLSPGVRSYYDVEDYIADVALHVIKRSKKYYDPHKAMESTWVYRVATNKCKSILNRYNYQKFSAGREVPYPEEMDRCSSFASATEEWRTAREAVERVVERGSSDVQDFVEILLSGNARGPRGVLEYLARDASLIEEFRKTARACSATARDFELVLRYCS